MEHYEDFEVEKEFEDIWDKVRYKRLNQLSELTENIITLLNKHIGGDILFDKDYLTIQNLFRKMKQNNYIYNYGDMKEIVTLINYEKYSNLHTYRECVRNLKYIGDDNPKFDSGEVYTSTLFNGATYKFNMNGNIETVGMNYFERLS